MCGVAHKASWAYKKVFFRPGIRKIAFARRTFQSSSTQSYTAELKVKANDRPMESVRMVHLWLSGKICVLKVKDLVSPKSCLELKRSGTRLDGSYLRLVHLLLRVFLATHKKE